MATGLNDLVDDDERDQALAGFADLLVRGGLLFLDVREIDASRERADGLWWSTEVELESGSTSRSPPSTMGGRADRPPDS